MEQLMHTEKQNVLNEKGTPLAGYSAKSVLNYNRKQIKAPFYRIKEWDFYQISNSELCLQFTIGHASYAGQVTAMLFNFKTGEKICEKTKMLALPFSSLKMGEDAEKDNTLTYNKSGMYMSFIASGDTRVLKCQCEDFSAEIELTRQNPHSLVINLPFDEKDTCFYYNHKINCMTAKGYAMLGDRQFDFDKNDSYGILDWGRGVWPFHNEWYWSNGTGLVDGEIFGFNLGCGFGNSSKATENILFYKGGYHKLGKVTFTLGKSYNDPWVIEDDAGRLKLTLVPTYDRTTAVKLLWVDNCTHQMFGSFNGYAVLDDGTKLLIDNIISFAEHAVNNW